MLRNRLVWCPNVVLLEKDSRGTFQQAEIEQLIKQFKTKKSLLFVEIGFGIWQKYKTQIVIGNPNYAIYRVTDLTSSFSQAFKPDASSFYFYVIDVTPAFLKAAYIHFMDILDFDYPIVCLAEGLHHLIQPALIIYPNADDTEDTHLQPVLDDRTKILRMNELSAFYLEYKSQRIEIIS